MALLIMLILAAFAAELAMSKPDASLVMRGFFVPDATYVLLRHPDMLVPGMTSSPSRLPSLLCVGCGAAAGCWYFFVLFLLLGIVDGGGVVFAMDVGGGGLVMAAW